MTLGTLSFFVLVWLFPIGKKGCQERDLPAPTYIWKTARRRDRFDVAARNLPPFARWPLPLLALPACIFYSVSPPAWSFRRCRGGICLLLHAGRWLCSPRRRAFFILFLRRHGCFDDGGEEFVSFCTLAAAFLHLAGVQKGAVGK